MSGVFTGGKTKTRLRRTTIATETILIVEEHIHSLSTLSHEMGIDGVIRRTDESDGVIP